ncbi:hypothetical protein RMATCC62417_02387 [Rhizopus microsporus]|nr:hypothetical protein RMATCC62417_02387 [Rhizopus microsporus]
MVQQTKVDTEENEKLKTQIDASISTARSLVQSWLPPPKPGEKLQDDDDDFTLTKYSTGRPDRLGLGAKYLSHKEAMRHNESHRPATKQEIQLKNKILNQNRRVNTSKETNNKKRKADSDDDDDDEDSKTTNNTKKKANRQGDFLSMYLTEQAAKKKKKKK